jgi:hypothetical protein
VWNGTATPVGSANSTYPEIESALTLDVIAAMLCAPNYEAAQSIVFREISESVN